jgi:glycosyltransferase involved in cell wall biosynthesis
MANKVSSDILIVSGVCFLRAYSGTLHMARALRDSGHTVRVLVSATEAEAVEYAALDISVYCLLRRERLGFFRKWQTIRHRLKVFFEILRSQQVIITENDYLLEASIAKKIRRNSLKLGQYCQELHLYDEYPTIPRIRIYNRLARVPDLVIDVEPNRARARMIRLGLPEMPLILRNTLPMSSIPRRSTRGGLAILAGRSLPEGRNILLHMGGVGKEKPLERVIDAIAVCNASVFFLAFCNAPEAQIAELNRYASRSLSPDAYAITGPRKRDELLASAWEADVGIVDYSPSVENTSNQRYCAPTKLYEFMALGLAVVGSDNDSLREIIEAENFGKCADEGSELALGSALNFVLKDPFRLQQMKDKAAKAFIKRHCYEALCIPSILNISTTLMCDNDVDDSLGDVAKHR